MAQCSYSRALGVFVLVVRALRGAQRSVNGAFNSSADTHLDELGSKLSAQRVIALCHACNANQCLSAQ